MKRVSAIEYDGQWNTVETALFDWVEQATEWCEARAGTLHWGDTQIGLEGNTPETIDALNADGIHPISARIFQVQAFSGGNPEQIEELRSFHWDPERMSDEELKTEWQEATQDAEDNGEDDWNIVAAYEAEVNKRGLNRKGG